MKHSCEDIDILAPEAAMTQGWEIYEEAAQRVLSDMREVLGLSVVEGKQRLQGASGTEWEVDAKALKEGSGGIVVIEVRRHTVSGVKQSAAATLAYQIRDLGAESGIVISPLPLQKGAQLIASHEGIAHVTLTPESTTDQYVAEFMGRCFLGASVTESAHASDASNGVIGWAKPDV